MKISKIVKKLGLFLAAYITYAIVLNLPVFDAKPSELVVSYQQGEALSAEHYRRLGLEDLDRDAEEAGRERFALAKAEGDRIPVDTSELISALSTGAEGWPITRYGTDFSELMRIAAIDENDEVFDSVAWQELNHRLATTDWRGLGGSSLDPEDYYYFTLELGALSPVQSRYWQLVYIIRNQDELALAEWLAQQMELIEHPNSLIDSALASVFSAEFIRELLELEFLSTATRTDLTSKINAFIKRIESNRGEIWAGVRERETRFGVGFAIVVSNLSDIEIWDHFGEGGWALSAAELMSLVFFQSQRSANRLVENLDRLQDGAPSCQGRSLVQQILWPQNVIGEILGDQLCEAMNMTSPSYTRYEEGWNNYVDSLVALRSELTQTH
ncbi:hypothetical protein [uncultured Umboniibacter sp.]|uniref:hypothetical protein n=1 Tax=uncultured Umboniibacter sp. TaxID=1798917 RepID=UPI0026192545|nr:hypothetical protein [uncultured Umboniibacter sp.]